jgi:hypothetical protein
VRVLSDGCRDYVVEVLDGAEPRLLRTRRGAIERLRSLGEACSVLRGCRVRRAVLRQRCAHDEATAGVSSGGAPFSEMPLTLAG